MIIRKYKKGDEFQIFKLDRLTETHPWNRRNLSNWYWKYKGTNPFGRSLVWVAEKNGRVVATFSAIPLNYRIKNKIIKGACSIAMIVHPDYQNKGLIKFVADKLFENAKSKKFKFIYGYPNENAYLIHKKFFLYQDVSQQKLFYKKISNTEKIQINKNIKVKQVDKFTNKINFFLDKVKSQRSFYLNRTKDYLNWRYSFRPDVNYKKYIFLDSKNSILGYIVLKIYFENKVKRGHIIDCFYDMKFSKLFVHMLEFSLEYFRKKKCGEITLWMQGDSKSSEILLKKSFKVKSKRPMICKFLNVTNNEKKVMTEKQWFFTMGDTLEIY